MQVSSQARRANMAQLQQAVPVASSFPFDDPTIELERMLGSAAPQLGRLGHQPTSIEQMEMGQSPSFTPPEHYLMEHKASTKPYDPLSKYGLSGGEHLMDMFMGGDTRKAKHAMFVGENPTDFFGEQRPVYDPAIDPAFMPIDMLAGAGLPQALKAAGKFGLKHSPEALEKATRTFSGGLAGMKPTMEMTAYHGSPHKFDRFKMSQIGTGEGAQAYGHGLYFAESPNVANQYRKELSKTVSYEGKPIYKEGRMVGSTGNMELDDMLIAQLGDVDAAILDSKKWLKELELKRSQPHAIDAAHNEIKLLEEAKSKIDVTGKGHLYEVDIPEEHVKAFLDWDAPLSEQSSKMREIAEKVGIIERSTVSDPWKKQYLAGVGKENRAKASSAIDEILYGDRDSTFAWNILNSSKGASKSGLDINDLYDMRAMHPDITGESIYKKLGGAEEASDYLNRAGVRGIKFHDAFSRDPAPFKGASRYRYAVDDMKKAGYDVDQAKAAMKSAYPEIGDSDLMGALGTQYDVGTRNLVVFDEDIIKTMSRNGTDLSNVMKELEAGNKF